MGQSHYQIEDIMKPKFKVFNAVGNQYLPEIGKFPGGEIRIKLPAMTFIDEVRIEANLLSSDDVMTLIMLTDAIRRYRFDEFQHKKIRLTMPYVPYARQDRVCNEGEAFSIAVFANLINSLQFSSVIITDPHSDVTPALIERCIVVDQSYALGHHKEFWQWYTNNDLMYLVAPDAGAVKKAYKLIKDFPKFKGIIFAEKVRDLATGNIIKTEVKNVPDDIQYAHLLVADDICDGGRTFVELAKVLQPYKPKSLNLFVTHGIFSKGLEVFDGLYDNVWSYNNFGDYK